MDVCSFCYDCLGTSTRWTGVDGESRIVRTIVGVVVIVAVSVADSRIGFDFSRSIPVDVVG